MMNNKQVLVMIVIVIMAKIMMISMKLMAMMTTIVGMLTMLIIVQIKVFGHGSSPRFYFNMMLK